MRRALKTAYATLHGSVSLPEARGHRRTPPYDSLGFVERTVGVVVALICEAVIVWVLLSSIYLSTWPVH